MVGGHAGLDFDPVVAERMRTLQTGSWLRLVDEHGEEGSVKVAWVSPLTSRLLLVNRRGMRVLAASVEELAMLASEGRLVIATGQSPFEAAMEQLKVQIRAAG